jgi:hypothetical protein
MLGITRIPVHMLWRAGAALRGRCSLSPSMAIIGLSIVRVLIERRKNAEFSCAGASFNCRRFR